MLCKTCPQKFGTPWSLLQHAQNVHALQIYLEQGDYSRSELQTVCIGNDNLLFPSTTVAEANRTSAARFVLVQGSSGEKQIVQIKKKNLHTTQSDLSSKTKSTGHKSLVLFEGTSQINTQGVGHKVVSIMSDENKNPSSVAISNLTQMPVPLASKSQISSQEDNLNQGTRQVIPIPVISSEPKVLSTLVKPVLPAVEKSMTNERLLTFVSPAIDNILAVPGTVLPTPTHISAGLNRQQIASAASIALLQSTVPDVSVVTSSSCDAEKKMDTSAIDAVVAKSNIPLEGDEVSNETDLTLQDKPLCCDNQDCGVTLMPVTHEMLKKCCSSTVPKKRKRHMATNHMPSMLKAKRKGDTYSVQVPTARKPFVIDIEHHSDHDESPDMSPHPQLPEQQETVTATVGGDTPKDRDELETATTVVKSTDQDTNSQQEHSVIIQPGNSISIPVSWESFKRMIDKPTSSSPIPIPVQFPGCAARMPISISVTPSGFPQIGEHDIKPVVKTESNRGAMPMQMVLPYDKDMIGKHKKRKYPTSRPFKCSDCEQRFNQRIHLQKHQSKHTGKNQRKVVLNCKYLIARL